jgi:hypothetical protein
MLMPIMSRSRGVFPAFKTDVSKLHKNTMWGHHDTASKTSNQEKKMGVKVITFLGNELRSNENNKGIMCRLYYIGKIFSTVLSIPVARP